jgi:DNA-binding LacI/PurR family transcriptional regulator
MQKTGGTKSAKNRISSVQVAHAAGVSQAAVSRVFTPGASVSEKMRARVLGAAHKLGYHPNVLARSLTRRSTNIIGIVMFRFTNPFYARLLKEFSRKLQARNYWTLLLNSEGDETVEVALPAALQYQVDGIIITSATLSSTLAEECARTGTPVVLFNRYSIETNVNAVCCDSVGAGRMVADALVDAGHTRYAFIAGEENASTSRDRERGFAERLRERGHELAMRDVGNFTYEDGYAAAQRLLKRPDRPDAIFCASDLTAMAVFDVATCEMGLLVPDELSIVGFDDISLANWPRYRLTTVHQPLERMVDATIDVLMNAIENPQSERVLRLISASLILRNTTRSANRNP